MFKKEEYEVEEPIYEEKIEWIPTGKYSDITIDIDDLAKRVTDACNELYQNGYDVIKIIEVIGGRYYYESKPNIVRLDAHCGGGGYSYGYGYSVTDGVIIIAKLRNLNNEKV